MLPQRFRNGSLPLAGTTMRQNGPALPSTRYNMSQSVQIWFDPYVAVSTYEHPIWSRHCSSTQGGLRHELKSNVRSGPYSFSGLG